MKQVAKAHRKVSNLRRDFLHKQSRKLVNAYGTMVFEELEPASMSKRPMPKQDDHGKCLPNGAAAKGGLNKSILDAGWGQFQQFCTYQAANASIRASVGAHWIETTMPPSTFSSPVRIQQVQSTKRP